MLVFKNPIYIFCVKSKVQKEKKENYCKKYEKLKNIGFIFAPLWDNWQAVTQIKSPLIKEYIMNSPFWRSYWSESRVGLYLKMWVRILILVS